MRVHNPINQVRNKTLQTLVLTTFSLLKHLQSVKSFLLDDTLFYIPNSLHDTLVAACPFSIFLEHAKFLH